MSVRHLGRLSRAVLVGALSLAVVGRADTSAQQPAPPQGAQPPQGAPPQGAPGGQGGRGGFQLKNVQVLKDVPPDQWQNVMQYVAASLGVQCNYCHVMGDNASDDKDTKKTARKMMQMVSDLNGQFFAGKPAVSCASCHNGHPKPSRTPHCDPSCSSAGWRSVWRSWPAVATRPRAPPHRASHDATRWVGSGSGCSSPASPAPGGCNAGRMCP